MATATFSGLPLDFEVSVAGATALLPAAQARTRCQHSPLLPAG